MLAERLTEIRESNRISQGELAKRLQEKGFTTTTSTISRWEKGNLIPSASQFLALCEVFDIEDIRQTFTGIVRPLDMLSGLNYNGRTEARRIIKCMMDSPLFTTIDPPRRQSSIIPFYDLPASAGSGVFLDSDGYEHMEVDDTVPKEATMAIRISGDSMTPRFADRQIVFVKEQPAIDIGQIGIFILNNEGYIKKLGGDSLISLNPKYKPIRLRDHDELRTVGRVLC